eukprot:662954-Hanusia_phi.AAC.3
MRDPETGRPLFAVRCIELACQACKDDGKAAECVHMLHLVPQWQSGERHRRLKVMMQDRPDLIQSELAGLAFDSLQQVFRSKDIDTFLEQEAPPFCSGQTVWITVDPAAGGPQSDYAIVSIVRSKGLITGSPGLVAQVVRHDATAQLLEKHGRLVSAQWIEHDAGARVWHRRAQRLLQRHVHVQEQH